MLSQEQAHAISISLSSASSPQQIISSCTSIEDYLSSHPSNQSLPFFSLSFPSLLSRLFFNHSSSLPWIDHTDPQVKTRVSSLLSPGGVLFSSVLAVDRLSCIKFVYPLERLPLWMRFALQSEKLAPFLENLCPLFESRVKENELVLSVLEYFFFWFAYYPVCRGRTENSGSRVVEKTKKSWQPFDFSAKKNNLLVKKKECGLYLKILYEYLMGFDSEFLIHTLVQFWMVDSDFSPLSRSLCSSLGLNFPFQRMLVEKTPPLGLGEVVKLLVVFLNGSGKFSAVIQRPLYRFILRSFLFCPVETSMEDAGQMISLWGCYLEPWSVTPDVFLEFGVSKDKIGDVCGGKEKMGLCEGYSSAWQGYVTSNYLFYDSLFVHFLGFAHKLLHNNVEKIVLMVLKVLNILTSSKELIGLLKNIDAAYHSKPSAYSDTALSKLVPTIRQQLQDWEDGLCESEVDGSFLHENWNKDLRLFGEGEDGAHWLLQLFVVRAESEIRAFPRDGPARDLDGIRAKMGILFGGPIRTAHHQPLGLLQAHAEPGFSPKHPGGPKWAEIKYRGDWMRRPISEGEVAWLAGLLINLSVRLNAWLGLDHPADNSGPEGPITMDLGMATGPIEVLWMVLALVSCWLGSLGRSLAHYMRKRGARINLRPMASKKIVLVLIVSIATTAIRRLMGRA